MPVILPPPTFRPAPPGFEIEIGEIHGPHQLPHMRQPTQVHWKKRTPWHLLHEYRGCDPAWLAKWERIIPTGRCNCKEGYRAILETHPPDFSSPEAFFAWGIRLHNAVNAKINAERGENRRIYTMEEAYSEWRQDDGEETLVD